MSEQRQGIIANSLNLLSPIICFTQQWHSLRFLGDRLIILTVRLYQRYISPYKGFSCAYTKLHSGLSCSEFFKQTVSDYGLSQAVPLFQERLEACKFANLQLKAESQEENEKERKKRNNNFCDDFYLDFSFCDTGDCGSCDHNHDGNLDCSDCNVLNCDGCDGLDFGSLDCGGCDFGSALNGTFSGQMY